MPEEKSEKGHEKPREAPLSHIHASPSRIRSIGSFLRKLFLAATVSLPLGRHEPGTQNTELGTPSADHNATAPKSLLTKAQEDLLFSIPLENPQLEKIAVNRTGNNMDIEYEGQKISGALTKSGQLTQLSIAGRSILYTEPINAKHIPLAAWNAAQAMQRINEYQDLAILLSTDTHFEAIGSARLQFSIQKNGEKVHYIATPHDVLRLTNKRHSISDKVRTDYRKKSKEILDQHLSAQSGDSEAVDWDQYMGKYPAHQHEKARRDLLAAIDEMNILEKNYDRHTAKDDTRVLIDDRTGNTAYERHAPMNTGYFRRVTEKGDGSPISEEQYFDDRLSSRTLYGKNTTLTARRDEKNIWYYVADGQTSYSMAIRNNGTVEWRCIPGKRDHYNEREAIDFRIESKTGFNKKILLFDATNNEFFDPLTTPFLELKKRIDTPEKYYVFEEQCRYNRSLSPERLNEMRVIGKDVCGVNGILRRIEQAYGNQFVINVDQKPAGTTFDVCSMSMLETTLPLIERILQRYPADFFQRINLKDMTLVTGSHSNKGGFGSLEGYNENTKVVLTLRDPAIFQKISHHEFFHQLEQELDTLYEKDHWWEQSETRGERRELTQKDYARDYGATNSLEDKATVAEALMVSDTGRIIRAEAKNNAVLAAKILWVEEMYYVASDGKIDRTYWDDVVAGTTINDSYWKRRTQEGFAKNEQAEVGRGQFNLHLAVKKEKDALRRTLSGDERARAIADLSLRALSKHQVHEHYRAINNLCMDGELSGSIAIEYLFKAATLNPAKTPFFIYNRLYKAYEQENRPQELRELLHLIRDRSPAYRKHAIRWLQELENGKK